MSTAKFFALKQINGIPAEINEISEDSYKKAVSPTDPAPDPDNKLYIAIEARPQSDEIEVKVSEIDKSDKINWSISKGDAYADGQFIDGNNQGNISIENKNLQVVIGVGFFTLDLSKMKMVPRETYRLYVAVYGKKETESFIDFIYEKEVSKKLKLEVENQNNQLQVAFDNATQGSKYDWAIYQGEWNKGGKLMGNERGIGLDEQGMFHVKLSGLKAGNKYNLYVARSIREVSQAEAEESQVMVEFTYIPNDNSTSPVDPTPNEPIKPSEPVKLGEIKALKVTKEPFFDQIRNLPTYTLPVGAINVAQSDLPFEIQVELAKRGMVNFIHANFDVNYGGWYNENWNQKGLKYEKAAEIFHSYEIPMNVGLYRMMYSNAIRDIWPKGAIRPTSQKALNERIAGFTVDFQNAIGMGGRPSLQDLDFEEGEFFTYAAVEALGEAIEYALAKYPHLQIQVYASSHNNLATDGGGNAANPEKSLNPWDRFMRFKKAGVKLYQGTVPYLKVPSAEWLISEGGLYHTTSVVGEGKIYASEKEYGLMSIKAIYAKLGWTDSYFSNIPVGHHPANLEWYMSVYEGGDDGGERKYDNEGNPWTSYNWPEVGEWIQESFPVWSLVTGSYRFGGGAYLWTDSRPWKVANVALELGKVRQYALNEFQENPDTVFNLVLEFSIDGGKTWITDKKPRGNNPEFHLQEFGYTRGAYVNGKLLIVATAGQPSHSYAREQKILIRYQGQKWEMTLKPKTVHAFVVEV